MAAKGNACAADLLQTVHRIMGKRRATRPSGGRLLRKGEARRLQILGTAKSLLLEGGPGAVVLREVAARLGMTHSNIQYYFRTRHDMLVAIYDAEIQKYMVSVDAGPEADTGEGGVRRLDAIIDAGLALVRSKDTALWRLMVGMLDHSPEMAALHRKECRRYEDRLCAALEDIAPSLSPAYRRAIAVMIQAFVDGMSIRAVYEPRPGAATRLVDESIKRAFRSLVEKN
jgi:AcrR family transcriptional regulator